MGTLTDIVKAWADEYLNDSELTTRDEGDRATLKFTVTGESGEFTYRAFFEVKEAGDFVQLFIYPPAKAPAARRVAVSELVVRINHELMYGYLDLDPEDGGLRFYADLNLTEGTLSTVMLDRLLQAGLSCLEWATPLVMAVAYANLSPAEALAREQAGDSELPSPESAEAPPWEHLAGATLLQGWSKELQAACAAKDAEAWRLTGHAVILVVEDFAQGLASARRVAADAGLRLVFIPDHEVMAMPSPTAFVRLAPVILYLEPGRWLLPKQEDDSEEFVKEVEAFQRRLAEGVRAFDPQKPVILVTANTTLGDMTAILDGPERFDRYLALPAPSLEARGQAFLDDLGPERCGPTLRDQPGKLGKLIVGSPNNPNWRHLALLYLQRLHRRTGQPLEFLDLMHLAMRGFAEAGDPGGGADEAERRQTAIHEAGHAAVAILDSGGLNIPDYCSIVPGADFKGVVAESVAYHQSRGERFTYWDLRHQIRISLAGRVAEEVVFGPEQVSSGAAQDLENCYRHASSAFFRYGFAPDMAAPGASASNLAIVVGKPTPSEYAHNETLVRAFLATEYQAVRQLLEAHRPLLEAIAARLLWDPIVDQQELQALCRENATPLPPDRASDAGQSQAFA